MSSGNGSVPPNLADIKRLSNDGIRVQIGRGSIDAPKPCNICHVLTDRVTSFKLNTESVWNFYVQCDSCCSAQAIMICRVGGLLRKGI
jgi:hypothetical protein